MATFQIRRIANRCRIFLSILMTTVGTLLGVPTSQYNADCCVECCWQCNVKETNPIFSLSLSRLYLGQYDRVIVCKLVTELKLAACRKSEQKHLSCPSLHVMGPKGATAFIFSLFGRPPIIIYATKQTKLTEVLPVFLSISRQIFG
jgi:hypothetical protein